MYVRILHWCTNVQLASWLQAQKLEYLKEEEEEATDFSHACTHMFYAIFHTRLIRFKMQPAIQTSGRTDGRTDGLLGVPKIEFSTSVHSTERGTDGQAGRQAGRGKKLERRRREESVPKDIPRCSNEEPFKEDITVRQFLSIHGSFEFFPWWWE